MEFKRQQKTVLLASYGFYGIFIPILRIGQYLRKCGYNVVMAMSNCNVYKGKQIMPFLTIIGVQDQFQQIRKPEWKGKNPFPMFERNWNKAVPAILQKYKPDLIISDFTNCSVLAFGRKMNIPIIGNIPESLNTLTRLKHPNLRNSFNIGGFTILYHPIEAEIYNAIYMTAKKSADQYLSHGLCLVNSFFGFDEGMILPPNVKLTGPLLEEIAPFDSKSVSNELNAWLHEIEQQNLDIIYVTMGTIVFLSQPFINKLYESLKRTGKAVLWSLKTGEIPQKNPKFFVEKWLPQSELLKLASVKVVISHCGFGAVMEAIHNQKPILALPGFIDQHSNALNVQKRGLGLILRRRKYQSLLVMRPIFDDATWTHEQFQQKINKIMNSQEIKQNLKKMNYLSRQAGGLVAIEQYAYNAIKNGLDHLVDPNLGPVHARGLSTNLKLIAFLLIIYAILYFKDLILKTLQIQL